MHQNAGRLAVGIDIGGTNLKLGLIDEQGRIHKFSHHPVVFYENGIASIDHIADSIQAFMAGTLADVTGIGVCTPGNLDVKTGFIYDAVNMGWENVAIGSLLEERLKLPVYIESDVVAGAYGEYHFGSARGKSTFLYISIGTGIGGSFFNNGQFMNTTNDSVLNIGHMSLVLEGLGCGCGNKGCLEQYVSGAAITRRVHQERATVATRLNEARQPDEFISLKDIYDTACGGDPYSQELLVEAGTYLGVAIVNMIHLFGPGPIVIGGGVSQLEHYLIERAREVVSSRIKPYLLRKTEILIAAYPQEAGILGAAYAALEKNKP